MKVLKNLLMLGLLGFAIVGCEEASSTGSNWENYADPSASKAFTASSSYKLGEIGTTSADGIAHIGAPRDSIKNVADYTKIVVKAKDGLFLGSSQASIASIDDFVAWNDDASELTIDVAAVYASDNTIAIGAEILKVEFLDSEYQPVKEFVIVL